MDNVEVILSLRDSSFPLAQCTRLEVCGPFEGIARFSTVDACFKSEDIFGKMHDVLKTSLEGSCEVFMYEEPPSLDFDNIALRNPLDDSRVSPIRSLPSPSLDYYFDVLIDNPMIFYSNDDLGYEDDMFHMLGGNVDNFMCRGYFSGYNASLDAYCMCLVDAPRKIIWNTFFDFYFDFSMAFGLLERALTFFIIMIFTLSYSQACEPHDAVFDKLLYA